MDPLLPAVGYRKPCAKQNSRLDFHSQVAVFDEVMGFSIERDWSSGERPDSPNTTRPSAQVFSISFINSD